MAASERTCPECGSTATRKDGHNRRGQQRFRCRPCRRRFTALIGTPFSGYRFPPDIIALAVRWYLRYRLSYAEVVERKCQNSVLTRRNRVELGEKWGLAGPIALFSRHYISSQARSMA